VEATAAGTAGDAGKASVGAPASAITEAAPVGRVDFEAAVVGGAVPATADGARVAGTVPGRVVATGVATVVALGAAAAQTPAGDGGGAGVPLAGT
jgi:hypothetical protein